MIAEALLKELRTRVICVSGQEVDALLDEIESLRETVLRLHDAEKREARLAKWTRYYFGANELRCEVSTVKNCDECAVCRVWMALNGDPEKE